MSDGAPAAALVDLDGTVVSGETVIEGAREGLEALTDADVPTVFLTNRATETPEHHAKTLRAGGIDAAPEDVLTSAGIVAASLDSDDGPALVLGDDPLLDALADAGIERTSNPDAAETVLASVDTRLSFDRLTAAARAVEAGARFLATNPDGARPTPTGLVPETGAVSAALTAATGKTPTVLGKPDPAAVRVALQHLGMPSGSIPSPADCLVIGDNPATDVRLGNRVGATTVLVGESPPGTATERGPSPEMSADTSAVPDYRLDSLAALDTVLEALRCA